MGYHLSGLWILGLIHNFILLLTFFKKKKSKCFKEEQYKRIKRVTCSDVSEATHFRKGTIHSKKDLFGEQ